MWHSLESWPQRLEIPFTAPLYLPGAKALIALPIKDSWHYSSRQLH